MKRLGFWSLSLALAMPGTAALANSPYGVSATPAATARESAQAWDYPPAAPAPPGAPVQAYGPMPGLHHYPSLAPIGGCGGDLGFGACCEREYSPLDGVWAGYCAQKPMRHPASVFFGALHIHRNPCPCPPAPCQGTCEPLPPLFSFTKKSACAESAPACESCELSCDVCGPAVDCGKCARPRRLPRLLQPWPSCGGGPATVHVEATGACVSPAPVHVDIPHEPAYGEDLGEAVLPLDAPPGEPLPMDEPRDAAPEASDPADASPSDEALPEVPPPSADRRDGRGWLALPRFKWLPQ